VEKWTKDGTKVDRLLYAGNNLKKARELFAAAIKHRPRIRLTIRERTRVLKQVIEKHSSPQRCHVVPRIVKCGTGPARGVQLVVGGN
jgi:hypothetical protein